MMLPTGDALLKHHHLSPERIACLNHMKTLKYCRIGTSKIISLIILHTEQFWFYNTIMHLQDAIMHLQDADRMANSADPGQTAPKEQSDLGLLCLHRPTCISSN